MASKILIVDDTPASLKLLADLLKSEGYEVRPTTSGELALKAAQSEAPDLILLDVRMPVMDGYEVCRRLKALSATRDIPVIFVSAASDTEEKVRGFEIGAVDFVTKPFQRDELLARVRTHLELGRLRAHLDELVAERTARLTETERRLATILNGNKMHLWAFDGDRYTYVNQQWFDYTGQNPDEPMNIEKWTSAVHPDDLKKSVEVWMDNWDTKTEHDNYFRLRRHDGVYRDFYCHAVPVFDDQGVFRYFQGFNLDITERKKAEEEIRYLAFYDPLTGLANRRLMADRMIQHLAHAKRTGELVAICMIDLDGFKQVNDQLGHKSGDILLIEVARRLQECLRQSDTASRFGGDEFSLILGDFRKISECEQSLNRIIAALAAPYQINGKIAHVTASIGATIFPYDGETPDLLLRHADQSMYEAKQAGKNCYRLFNPVQHNQQLSNQAILKKIRDGLEKGQFKLYYQPQIDCRKGRVCGVEALIRWEHPVLGLLSPSEFIPLLEHDDLIIAMGEWVILEALAQLTKWHEQGIEQLLSINIAARQLHQSNFPQRLKELLADYGSDIVHRLMIEIVETAALEDINLVSQTIRQCRALGVQFAIDDFGTGFSSLSHLKHLHVDELKIDQSFVLGMLNNQEDLAIVSGVIGLGSSFRHKVVAEGVETIDHILMLMDLGCDIMQGYVFARPMPAEKFPAWLAEFVPDPLWQLPLAQTPSRSYFELLLAENNHHHWIKEMVRSHCNTQETADPAVFLDTHRCRLGHWYHGQGMRQFGNEDWFRSIDPVHQRVHQSALRLCEFQCSGDTVQATEEAARLSELQIELDELLKKLRGTLSEQYLTAPKHN